MQNTAPQNHKQNISLVRQQNSVIRWIRSKYKTHISGEFKRRPVNDVPNGILGTTNVSHGTHLDISFTGLEMVDEKTEGVQDFVLQELSDDAFLLISSSLFPIAWNIEADCNSSKINTSVSW